MGYFIASIQNELEDAAIAELIARELPNDSSRRVWLGGQAIATKSDTFVWADGSQWNYSNFHPAEPNNHGGRAEDCLNYHYYYTSTPWNDESCSKEFYAVYRKFPLDVSSQPSLSSQPSTLSNAPSSSPGVSPSLAGGSFSIQTAVPTISKSDSKPPI